RRAPTPEWSMLRLTSLIGRLGLPLSGAHGSTATTTARDRRRGRYPENMPSDSPWRAATHATLWVRRAGERAAEASLTPGTRDAGGAGAESLPSLRGSLY